MPTRFARLWSPASSLTRKLAALACNAASIRRSLSLLESGTTGPSSARSWALTGDSSNISNLSSSASRCRTRSGFLPSTSSSRLAGWTKIRLPCFMAKRMKVAAGPIPDSICPANGSSAMNALVSSRNRVGDGLICVLVSSATAELSPLRFPLLAGDTRSGHSILATAQGDLLADVENPDSVGAGQVLGRCGQFDGRSTRPSSWQPAMKSGGESTRATWPLLSSNPSRVLQ